MSGIMQMLMASAGAGGSATYLDNLATSPRCALSFKKKLISTATSCFRVRRSSDSTEQDIGFVGTARDDSALSSFVGANSGFIRTGYDQAGNSEDANQSTAANQPTIVASGVLGDRASFDTTNDSLVITSLTQGSAYLGIYYKGRTPPSGAGLKVMFEGSTNYNNVTQSFVVYFDNSTGNRLVVASRNSTSVNDFRAHQFPLSNAASCRLNILIDRTTTGTNEIRVWDSGVELTAVPTGTPADQTGVFSAQDVYIGARAGSSLFGGIEVETLVFYNADTSSIRSSIDTIIS